MNDPALESFFQYRGTLLFRRLRKSRFKRFEIIFTGGEGELFAVPVCDRGGQPRQKISSFRYNGVPVAIFQGLPVIL